MGPPKKEADASSTTKMSVVELEDIVARADADLGQASGDGPDVDTEEGAGPGQQQPAAPAPSTDTNEEPGVVGPDAAVGVDAAGDAASNEPDTDEGDPV